MELDRIIAVRNTKTVYRGGGEAIKVFIRDYSKADILTEAANLARAEAAGLPVPKLLRLETPDDRWAIVTEYIRGKTLTQQLMQGLLTAEDAIRCLAELAFQVHTASGVGLLPLSFLLKQDLARADVTEDVRAALYARFASLPEGTSLCHGDLALENLITDTAGRTYLLDWPHASQGCGTADAVWAFLRLELDGKMEEAAYFAKCYCTIAAITMDAFSAWIPVIAATRSVHARPESRAILLKRAESSL